MSRSGAPLAVVWLRDVVGPSAVRDVTVKRRSRYRFDPAELVVLAAFAVMSAWVLLLGLWWTVTQGRVWTGVDGVYVQDVTQYLAWIRDASRHVLVSDLFVSSATPHDYLQPAIAVSGGLVAIGVAPWLALLLWQPVAVGGTFLADPLARAQSAARTPRPAGGVGARVVRRLDRHLPGPVAAVVDVGIRVRGPVAGDDGRLAPPVRPCRSGRRPRVAGGGARRARELVAPVAGSGPGSDHRGRGDHGVGPTPGVAGRPATTQPRAAGRRDWSRSRCRSPTTRCSVVPTRRGGWPESRSKEGSPSGRCW